MIGAVVTSAVAAVVVVVLVGGRQLAQLRIGEILQCEVVDGQARVGAGLAGAGQAGLGVVRVILIEMQKIHKVSVLNVKALAGTFNQEKP